MSSHHGRWAGHLQVKGTDHVSGGKASAKQMKCNPPPEQQAPAECIEWMRVSQNMCLRDLLGTIGSAYAQLVPARWYRKGHPWWFETKG